MSEIRVDNIQNREGTSGPTITGITTFSFAGYAVTVTASGIDVGPGSVIVNGQPINPGIGTANVTTNSLVVSGVSTLGGVVAGVTTVTTLNVSDTINALTGSIGVATVSTGIVTGALGIQGQNIYGTVIDASGELRVGTAVTINSGIITATQFVGDGSQLTGIGGTSNIVADTLVVQTGISTINAVRIGSATTATTDLYVDGNGAARVLSLGNLNGNVSLDFTSSNNFAGILTGNSTFTNPTGVTTGQSGVIILSQEAVGLGTRTAAWGSYFKFKSGNAPSLSVGAGKSDLFAYFAQSPIDIVIAGLIGIGS